MNITQTRLFSTDVNIIKFSTDIRLDTTLGTPNKREDIRYMYGSPRPDEVTALRYNLSFFILADIRNEELGRGRGDCFVNVAYDGKRLYFEPDIPKTGMLWEVPSSYMLMRNGLKDTTGQQELKSLTYPGPRTAWGQDANGNLYVFVIEGRRLGQKGLSANEIYELCRRYGLTDAITADGGGSTVAFIYDKQVGRVWDGRAHGRIMVGYSKYKLSQLPNVKKGARGVYVNLLQRLLNIMPDGRFGNQTREAVINYQRLHGLIVDGKVGPQTWGSLTKGVIN